MGFELGRRTGRYWQDAHRLNQFIFDYAFHLTSKHEKAFENGLASSLMTLKNEFNAEVITQIDKSNSVRSVYCFGKKHRPDIAFDDNGIAMEVKFVTYSGLKQAIGQGYLYRLRYRFVFLVLILSEQRKSVYIEIAEGREKDLEDTLQHLADEMNIFTYIVPAFNVNQPGIKKCISFFEPVSILA